VKLRNKFLGLAGAVLLSTAIGTGNVEAEASTWTERSEEEIKQDIQVDENGNKSYTITYGDTLHNISEAIGIQVSTIADRYNIDDVNLIIPGNKITTVDNGNAEAVSVENEQTKEVKSYEVQEEKSEPVQTPKKEEPKNEVKGVNTKKESTEQPVQKPQPTKDTEQVEPSQSLGNFEATAYAVGSWAVPGTVTADGTDISNSIYGPDGNRIIATDPSVIPTGSVVRVTLPNGNSFVATARDVGGMIQGNTIDILVNSPEEGLQFGRQSGLKVEII